MDVLASWVVQRCGDCGYIEGEEAQAGCCRKCGQRSEPEAVGVVPASQLAGAVSDAVALVFLANLYDDELDEAAQRQLEALTKKYAPSHPGRGQ